MSMKNCVIATAGILAASAIGVVGILYAMFFSAPLSVTGPSRSAQEEAAEMLAESATLKKRSPIR
jgi:hypothetical protein